MSASPTLPGADWLAALDEPAWLVDAAQLTLLQANPAAAAWLGQPLDQLAGRAADELLPSLEDAVFWADVRAGRPGRLVSDTELPRGDGQVVQIHRRIVPLGPQGEAAACYLVSLRDRSADSRVARERETLLAELRATLEATADGILVVDIAGRIRAFNRRFAAMWDLPAAVLTEQDDPAVLDWMRQSVLQPTDYQRRLDEIDAQLLLSATDTVPLLNGTLLERHTQPQWSAGRPIGRVYSFRPLHRGRAALPREEEAVLSSGEDELTGWPNRSALLTCLDEAVIRARTSGQSLTVLCVEYDRQALFAVDGDARARVMADLIEGLRAHLNASQRVARLGAARFAILLPDASEARAAPLVHRLLDTARRSAQGLLATAGVPLQIGMAVYPQSGLGADDLLQHAEQALHRAQAQAGADAADPLAWLQVHQLTAQPLPDGRRQQRLERAVHEGLAHPAFRLHYQPRVDSHTGQVQAVEALLRWQDPEDGLLLPALFLPLAERAGLMGALDDWVMEHALRQAATWRAAGWVQSLTVNVSAAALCQPAYARRVAALLEATGWPARLLELDLQEAALQRDPETALYNLQALQRLGVRLVLDDWGTGDCSLGLLRRYPFHAVKLDRSLIRQVPRQAAENAMVQGLVSLARALGLQVLAEGVEHASQRQFVTQAGCDGWQGLLASAALDARACERGVLARAAALAQRVQAPPRAANE
ncbi:EAL domain-containing protein [Ideonella azotifigens]|uniref:EAL domain-containing protein n=2 Tax=Ideonella azotifigens TaxID=513160 RepID=A0ABN1KL43_9BURK|nr:EAL domain-containing protein [Ideonella azotifigens]MCD2344772.1 EAL domain-containing protein [Ideonella azotifigens]